MSERFYTSLQIHLGTMELRGAEAHHLAVVSRISPGALIYLFSGDGLEYSAEVLEAKKNRVLLDVKSGNDVSREPKVQVTLLSPLPKSNRCDFLIEKLAEIGVHRFVPIDCEFSTIKNKQINTEKLRRSVIEASKQCLRNHLMKIGDPLTFEQSITQVDKNELNVIASIAPIASEPAFFGQSEKVNIWVGPEGGFSNSEIAFATEQGIKALSLGKTILRMETAAIVVATLAIHSKVAQ